MAFVTPRGAGCNTRSSGAAIPPLRFTSCGEYVKALGLFDGSRRLVDRLSGDVPLRPTVVSSAHDGERDAGALT